MSRNSRKKPNHNVHPFFILILSTIFTIFAILILAIILYGITTGTIIVIAILSILIITLILILKSYLKDTPTASEIFDIIPCRLGLGKIERKRFVQFCRRCNSAYIALIVIGVFIPVLDSVNVKILDRIYNFLIPKIGVDLLILLSIGLILSIPIQATIYAKLKKESEKLRIITGILFAIGVILLVSYVLKAYFSNPVN